MINVFQNEKEYTISVIIPIKKVNFSETPSKRDFKKFAEEVFEAYTNIIVEALEARMNACVNGFIKHSDNVKYCDITYLVENIFSLIMLMILCKDQLKKFSYISWVN